MTLIARALRRVRAGVNKTAWHHRATESAPETVTLTSTAFEDGGPIPQRHAGAGVGDDISPQLQWSGVPGDAVELVLIIEDPDAPLPRPVVHGLVTGIDPRLGELPERALNSGTALPIRIGVGSFRRRGYAGPRPIADHGPHRYMFQLFALDRHTGLGDDATRAGALAAVDGHVIARGKLTGFYERF
jgi:Raf kinase inhibitor-like YbhB/YbcL family protein